VAAAMLGTLAGPLGHVAHDMHGKRPAVDTLATAHRLHTKPKSGAENLWRLAGCAAAQHNLVSVAAMAGGGPCDRADAPGVSVCAGSRRGHSTATSHSVSSNGRRATSLQAASSVSDLRSVPGIGPKNEQLLVASGHPSLDALQQHFSEDVRGDTVAMSEYLRVSS
jgi:hypothetical protein